MNIHIDSFSGAIVDLKPKQRNTDDALQALAKSPEVSCFDLSELAWVRNLISDLVQRGLIVDRPGVAYPWHAYDLTEAGRQRLAGLPT